MIIFRFLLRFGISPKGKKGQNRFCECSIKTGYTNRLCEEPRASARGFFAVRKDSRFLAKSPFQPESLNKGGKKGIIY